MDLEKYSPVCVKPDEQSVKPDDQSKSPSSDQAIVHQVIGEQPKTLKQAHLQAHLMGWVLNSQFELYIRHNRDTQKISKRQDRDNPLTTKLVTAFITIKS